MLGEDIFGRSSAGGSDVPAEDFCIKVILIKPTDQAIFWAQAEAIGGICWTAHIETMTTD